MTLLATQGRWQQRTQLALTLGQVLLFAFWAWVCLSEIACWWQYGHIGFNGSTFAQAARVTLRHGVLGPVAWYAELEPPAHDNVYTHHPLLLHLHVVAAQWLGGSSSEWVTRLTPALYSFATLVLLWDLARRVMGRGFALLATALYVSFPGPWMFASTVIHEQGCLFWILASAWAYTRGLLTPQRRWPVATLLCLFLALNWGWAAYFAAFFLALHSLWRAWRLRRSPPERNRALLLVAGMTLTVVVSIGLFILWVVWVKGGLHEMQSTFRWRSSANIRVDRFKVSTWPIDNFYGWVPAILYLLFLPSLLWRQVRENAASGLALLFVLVQLCHSTVFRQAASIHAYWEYYAAPGVALGAALGLWGLWRAFGWLGARWTKSRPVALVASVALLLVTAALHLPYAWRKTVYGKATGGLSGEPYQDLSVHLQWLGELPAHFPPGSARFLVLGDLPDRPEVQYYLDGPRRNVRRVGNPPQEKGVRNVLLADLSRLPPPQKAQVLARLQKGGLMWDERFVAIDLSAPDSAPRAFTSRRKEAGWLWRWLVTPRTPPVDWEATQAAALPSDVQPTTQGIP